MDKIYEVAVTTLPAWLILVAVVVWLLGGREAVDRFWKRDERNVQQKRTELELEKIELERGNLRKQAALDGVALSFPRSTYQDDRDRSARNKFLVQCGIGHAFIFAFGCLPSLAILAEAKPPAPNATLVLDFCLMLLDSAVSVSIVAKFRDKFDDPTLGAMFSMLIFAALLVAYVSATSIISSTGVLILK